MKQSKFYQIKSITEHEYTLVDCGGSVITRPIQDVDKSASAFTIQDAKNGDVLACPNDAGDRDVVFIFKNINSDEGWVFCFCALDANGSFCTNNDYVGNSNSTNISPATREQRDQLEKAMADAGYTFDFEKRELKKIEQKTEEYNITGIGSKNAQGKLGEMIKNLKPAWSEEDRNMLKRAIYMMEQLDMTQSWDDVYNWLKYLKDRVLPQSKQEWSEEDEKARSIK